MGRRLGPQVAVSIYRYGLLQFGGFGSAHFSAAAVGQLRSTDTLTYLKREASVVLWRPLRLLLLRLISAGVQSLWLQGAQVCRI